MNITINSKIITPAKHIPAVDLPAVVEKEYILTLNEQEASDLMALCGGIGGPLGESGLEVEDTSRTTFNPIYFQLEKLNVIPNYERLKGLYSHALTLKI